MDRITHEGLQEAVAQERANRTGLDDRRDIADRDVVCYYLDPATGHLPTKLQIDDDVNIGGERDANGNVQGGMLVRIVGPAQGREWFCATGWIMPEDQWPTTGVYHYSQVVDRAPADANETGPHFPVIPEQTP